jgi:hypothetical protein
MTGWDMFFQAEIVEQPLRPRLPPIIARLPEISIREKTESRSGGRLNPLYQRYRSFADVRAHRSLGPLGADFVEKLFRRALWLHRGEYHFTTQLIANPDSKNHRRCETLFCRRRLTREAPD